MPCSSRRGRCLGCDGRRQTGPPRLPPTASAVCAHGRGTCVHASQSDSVVATL